MIESATKAATSMLSAMPPCRQDAAYGYGDICGATGDEHLADDSD